MIKNSIDFDEVTESIETDPSDVIWRRLLTPGRQDFGYLNETWQYLKIWDLKELKNKEIAKKLGISYEDENGLHKQIREQKDIAQRIIENVEKGAFRGRIHKTKK